ncbi:cytohesin-4 isoform X2 [Suricata suricatta]|uniref:cytohesin-4 isoform X2 n=1 Tax=Suricata suricatta TaxID=37032 RepID=UPI001155C0AC|nr:cytohesin-4 isoform X2 [Suricata suricatta]XP_029811810.1 cytohesin-4 isoform X2 [Suricata suricatta]
MATMIPAPLDRELRESVGLSYPPPHPQLHSQRIKLKDEIADVFAQIDCFENAEESRMAQKEKELCIGRKKFNMDPMKGIQYLIEHKLLNPDVQDIARFLYKGDGLNKTAIGVYLGERDPFNLQVLQAFVDCHEFANLNLVQALRQFLWSFRLPGEAQKIDRMMETFATRYCLCNPGVFQSTDTCYVLSFSIIMLNTSLHNPNVRDRPPFERFVSMNRGINDGGDLPEEQLRNLFDSIKSEPFSIPEDDGNDLTHTFFNPDREGWLLKLGGRVKTWKRRWFILTDNCLYYFEFTTDKEPRGIIPLENLSVQKVDDPKKPGPHPGTPHSSAWSFTTPAAVARRSRPARPTVRARWWRASMSLTESPPPAPRSATSGFRPFEPASPASPSMTSSLLGRRRLPASTELPGTQCPGGPVTCGGSSASPSCVFSCGLAGPAGGTCTPHRTAGSRREGRARSPAPAPVSSLRGTICQVLWFLENCSVWIETRGPLLSLCPPQPQPRGAGA